MKGTEKQIAWAQDIIAGVNRKLDLMISNYNRLDAQAPAGDNLAYDTLRFTPAQVERVRAQFTATFAQCDAARIIEFRNRFTERELESLARQA